MRAVFIDWRLSPACGVLVCLLVLSSYGQPSDFFEQQRIRLFENCISQQDGADLDPADSLIARETFLWNGLPLDSLNARVCSGTGKRISFLNLSGLNMESLSLPSNFAELDSLVYLDLSDNALARLPDEIGNLPLLQFLYLRDNRLSALPSALGDTRFHVLRFHVLGLQNNLLTELPETLFDRIFFTDCASGDRIYQVRGLYIESNRLCNPSSEAESWLDSMYSYPVDCLDSTTDWRKSQDCTDPIRFRQGSSPGATPEYYLTFPGWERFPPGAEESKVIDVRGRVLEGRSILPTETSNLIRKSRANKQGVKEP